MDNGQGRIAALERKIADMAEVMSRLQTSHLCLRVIANTIATKHLDPTWFAQELEQATERFVAVWLGSSRKIDEAQIWAAEAELRSFSAEIRPTPASSQQPLGKPRRS